MKEYIRWVLRGLYICIGTLSPIFICLAIWGHELPTLGVITLVLLYVFTLPLFFLSINRVDDFIDKLIGEE